MILDLMRPNNKENKMKITKQQLRRIIKEALQGETWTTVIRMSPNGDSVLVKGREVDPRNIVNELEAASCQSIPPYEAKSLEDELMKEFNRGYVEIPVAWTPDAGWLI